MDAIETWLFGAFVAAAAMELIGRSRGRNLFEDLLAKTPVTPPHLLEDGAFVRVTGRAVGLGPSHTSPVTGRRGLALAISLREGTYQPLLPGQDGDAQQVAPFFVVPEGSEGGDPRAGKVHVDPSAGTVLLLAPKAPSRSSGPVPASAREALRGLFSPRFWDDRVAPHVASLCYREALLEEGAWVTVAGLARRIVDVAGDAPHGRAPAMMWSLKGQAHRPLLVSDDRARFGF